MDTNQEFNARPFSQMLRRRLIVAACALAVFFLGILGGKYLFEPTEIIIPNYYWEQLSLLTWRGQSGELCFVLVPRIDRGRVIHDFWSKWRGQRGVARLKEALRVVPKDKHVIWTNSPPRFELPSAKFCDELVEFAKSNGVDLSINPVTDAESFSDWVPK